MTNQPIQLEQLEFDLADRMRRALRVSGIGPGVMADYLGVRRETVSTWITGRITPDKRTRMLFAMRTGVPIEWLETGQVPDQGPTPDGGSELPRLDSNQQPSDYRSAQVRRGRRHLLPALRAVA